MFEIIGFGEFVGGFFFGKLSDKINKHIACIF